MAAHHISPFSGEWYPEEASELDRLLESAFESSRQRTGEFLYPNGLGYVVPHAGPAYSGTVAAAAYRAIRQQEPERIVVLAFSHRGGLEGVSAPEVDTIATPLGEVKIDRSLDGAFAPVPEGRVCDHSFEIQLPFLQYAAPSARVTPLYVGRMDAEARSAAADALAAAWRPGTVFLASSDFTHYGRNFGYVPFPPDRSVASRLRALDFECIEAAGSLRSALFLKTLAEKHATVCGADPIALLIEVLRRLRPEDDLYPLTLDYQASGEITGDYHHSVSYAALGYFPAAAFELPAPDRQELLDSAERTLRQLRATGARDAAPAQSGSAALQTKRGAFVSLRQGSELLGCVGNCAGRVSLGEDVAGLALSAALEDPRFRPAAEALGPIDIEVSVLTPFRRVLDAERFHPGRHGAFLKLGGHAGLLLPQVATEYGWDAGQFLGALGRKSGLGADAWQDPRARPYVFEAQVFSRPGTV